MFDTKIMATMLKDIEKECEIVKDFTRCVQGVFQSQHKMVMSSIKKAEDNKRAKNGETIGSLSKDAIVQVSINLVKHEKQIKIPNLSSKVLRDNRLESYGYDIYTGPIYTGPFNSRSSILGATAANQSEKQLVSQIEEKINSFKTLKLFEHFNTEFVRTDITFAVKKNVRVKNINIDIFDYDSEKSKINKFDAFFSDYFGVLSKLPRISKYHIDFSSQVIKRIAVEEKTTNLRLFSSVCFRYRDCTAIKNEVMHSVGLRFYSPATLDSIYDLGKHGMRSDNLDEDDLMLTNLIINENGVMG